MCDSTWWYVMICGDMSWCVLTQASFDRPWSEQDFQRKRRHCQACCFRCLGHVVNDVWHCVLQGDDMWYFERCSAPALAFVAHLGLSRIVKGTYVKKTPASDQLSQLVPLLQWTKLLPPACIHSHRLHVPLCSSLAYHPVLYLCATDGTVAAVDKAFTICVHTQPLRCMSPHVIDRLKLMDT